MHYKLKDKYEDKFYEGDFFVAHDYSRVLLTTSISRLYSFNENTNDAITFTVHRDSENKTGLIYGHGRFELQPVEKEAGGYDDNNNYMVRPI